MNISNGALYFDAGINTAEWKKNIAGMRQDILGLSNTATQEANKIDSAFKGLSVGLAGYFSTQALVGFTQQVINIRGEFQKTEIAFATMLGSQEKASALMAQMVDLAAKTPFSLQEVSSGAKQLLAFKVPADEVVDTLTRMGNIASGLSVPISRINLVFGQVKAKGRLMGDDLRQFTEAGIPMVAELAKKFGKKSAEITDMVSAGKIGFNDVKEVLFDLTNEGGMFFNLMAEQSKTLSGKVSNLGDTWEQVINKIGQSSEGILGGGIDAISYTIENYEELLNIIVALTVSVGAYKTALIATSVAQNLASKTVASEIALLGISTKMKLGRALVSQKQAIASLEEAKNERLATQAKYSALQSEVSLLNAKKLSATQSAIAKKQKLDEAKASLVVARANEAQATASVTSTRAESASKSVLSAQNKVIALEESSAIARKKALAVNSQFYTAKLNLESSANSGASASQITAMRNEVASLAVKKQSAIQSAINARTRLEEAQVNLASARSEQSATLSGNALRAVENAQKKVQQAENNVLIAQEQAITARKTATNTATQFSTAQKELENTAIAVGNSAKKVEIAQEAVSATTKNVSAVATSKLTAKQMLQVTATKLATVATNALNKTLFANPYALATALIAGLTYAIYKYATAMTVAEESQKRMNEQASQQIGAIGEETSKIKSLIAVITDKNSTDAQQRSALEKIKSLSNGRLSSLTLESIKTGNATKAINKYVQALKDEAEAKRISAEIGNLDSDVKTLKDNRDKFGLSDVWDDFTDFDSSFQWNLKDRKKERVDKIVKEKESEKKLLQKKLDDLAKKGVKTTEDTPVTESPDSTKEEKEKKKKRERELAEVYSKGSIADLEQRIELWNNALKRASNGEVKVRARDKFGDEKETGEKVSITHAVEQVEILEKAKRKAEKLIRAKNFDEDIAELERQWSLKEILAQKYSKTYSDTIFPELKGSYFDDISKKFEELNKKANEGVKLSDEELEQWKKLKDILDSLNGTKSPLEMYKKSIEELKSSSKSAYQLLGYLKEELAHLADDNSLSGLQKKLLINEEIESATATVKEQYKDFLKTTESFETQRTEIQKRHSEMRQQIYADNTLSEPEKQKAVTKTLSNESSDVSQAFLDSIVNTEAWATNFDQIGGLALEQFKRIRAELLAQIQTLVASGVDKNDPAFQQIINRLKELDDVANKNPFTGLINSWNKFKEALKDGDNSLKGTAGKIAQGADMINQAMSMGLGMAQDLGIEFNEETKAIIGDVSKVIGGVGELANGIKNMDPVSIIKGIGSVISGISGLFNGDRKKEKNIQAWAKEVEYLKQQYEDLTRAIERSAGEANLTAQRSAVDSLKQQQLILAKMAKEEANKKKADSGKVAEYQNQIRAIDNQIEDLVNNFKNSITGTDFRSMSENLASALIEAFGKGEDAVTAFDKVVDDVMKNAVANALRIKILEPVVQQMVDKLYSSMGFGNGGASAEQEEQMKGLEDKLKAVNEKYKKATPFQKALLAIEKQKLEQQIEALKKQMQNNQMSGSFDGLTDAERDEIKAMGQGAMQQYMDALKQYEDLFGNAQQNATTLTGAVKGVTEETASIIAGLMNAMRIAQGEALQVNINLLDTCKNALIMLTQIEINTRHLGQIRTEITQMNLKIQNNSLRGVGLV